MRPGQFRDRIQIQGLSEVSDGAGGTTGTWLNTVEVWANVEPMKGRRLEKYSQVFSGKPFEVTFRYEAIDDVNNIQLYRAIHDSRALHFHSIIDQGGRNTWMTVSADMSQPTDTAGAAFEATVTDASNPSSPVTLLNGDAYTCLGISDLTTLTCSQLNDASTGITQAQRDFMHRRTLPVTGQRTSYRTGDDGDLEAGIGGTAAGITDDPWFILPGCNNSFGNRFRFTDENGDYYYDTDADGIPDTKNVAGAYGAANYMIDHLHGYGWVYKGISTSNWNAAIDGALAHSVLGYSDFRLPNKDEIESLCNDSIIPCMDWWPFALSSDFFFWSSTTVLNDTTKAKQLASANADTNGNMVFGLKTSIQSRIYVRNHF